MNEVRRLWVSTQARLNREWVGIQGIVVPAEDYDELASECALLRHRVAELTEGLDNYRAMLLDSDAELAAIKSAPVVMPPSPYCPELRKEMLTDYEIGELQGRCDMWEEVKRLNRSKT